MSCAVQKGSILVPRLFIMYVIINVRFLC